MNNKNFEKLLNKLFQFVSVDSFDFIENKFIVYFIRDFNKVKKEFIDLPEYLTLESSSWWFGNREEWKKEKQELSSSEDEPYLGAKLAKITFCTNPFVTDVVIIKNTTYLNFENSIKISIDNFSKWSLKYFEYFENNFVKTHYIKCKDNIFIKTESELEIID